MMLISLPCPPWVRRLLLVALVAVPGPAGATTFHYPDFTSTTGLVIANDAVALPDTAPTYIRLVGDYAGRDLTQQGGTAYSEGPIDAASFSTSFTFRITDPGGIGDGDTSSVDSTQYGGDGFAFVIQNSSNTAGSAGGGLGYAGLSPSVAVEFDTYCDFCGTSPGDPSGNHVAITVGGDVDHDDPSEAPDAPMDLEGGDILTAYIRSDGSVLSLWLDDTGAPPSGPALVTRDVSAELATLLASGAAFVGFTAATGEAYENIDLLSWDYAGVAQSCTEPTPTELACGTTQSAPNSDACDAREDYACLSGTSATGELGEERVYALTALADGEYTVRGTGSYDLFVLRDDGLGLQLDACEVGASGGNPEATFTATAGERWLVVVDEPSPSGGSHELSLDCPGDTFTPATDTAPYYGGGTASCSTSAASASALLILSSLFLSRRRLGH